MMSDEGVALLNMMLMLAVDQAFVVELIPWLAVCFSILLISVSTSPLRSSVCLGAGS